MLTCGAIKPAGTNADKKGAINMSGFIYGALTAIISFILGLMFGAALRDAALISHGRRIIISLPNDFADIATEIPDKDGGAE